MKQILFLGNGLLGAKRTENIHFKFHKLKKKLLKRLEYFLSVEHNQTGCSRKNFLKFSLNLFVNSSVLFLKIHSEADITIKY